MQRVKGHGNLGGVRNGTETNEHENVNNWTPRVWPISSNYYGASYPYATYCVGDASGNAWPATEPIAYVNYNGQLQPDAAAYGMEGVYNPSVGAAYAAATYAQPAPNNGAYNYYPTAPDYSAVAAQPHWNATAAKAYENYYKDPIAAAAAIESVDQRLQSLEVAETAASKLYASVGAGGGEKKTTTWASIAKQPAKPMPQTSSGGSKKKGPGMPPPPMVPGRNIDMNPWESKVGGGMPKAPPPVIQAPLPPSAIAKAAVWNGPTLVAEPPPPLMPACDLTAPPPHQIHAPHAAQLPPPQFDVSAPPPALPRKMYAAPAAPPALASTPSPPPHTVAPAPAPASQAHPTSAASHPATSATSTATAAQPVPTAASSNYSKGGENGAATGHSGSASAAASGAYCNSVAAAAAAAPVCSTSLLLSSSSCSSSSSSSTCSSTARSPPAHSVVDKLRDKNNYNPRHCELPPEGTRFFVIKSYSEDDVHRSIKYEIWCSTERGNKRLDEAYADQNASGGAVYLFFSVNGSGHFCGVAQMCSPVDYGASSSVWAQDKWKGQFGVRWVYVKDVPNSQLRHIRLENNENKPVTNSRDTQEVPYDKGLGVFKIIHQYSHTTSIFDDFTHYEKRQEEGDSNRRGGPAGGGNGGGGGGERGGGGDRGGGGERGGGGGVLMQRGGPPPQRPNPFATRGSAMHKDREGGGGSSFSQMNQNRRGGRNNGSVGFTNHRSNHSSMLRS